MAAHPDRLNVLSLCSGVGAMDLGLHLALGGSCRSVCYVERDAYAASILVARMEDSALDQAPVWDDLTTFQGSPWRGAVDLICAGFPCQPWSAAGKRQGVDDERWLWPAIDRIIRDVRPDYVFLENVPGLANGGLGLVLGSLAEAGFDAEWDLFRADEAGAPHRRQRLFILAHRSSRGREGEQQTGSAQGPVVGSHPELADSGGERRQQVSRGAHGHEGTDAGGTQVSADVASGGQSDVADTSSVCEREQDNEARAESWQDARRGPSSSSSSMAYSADIGHERRGESRSRRSGLGPSDPSDVFPPRPNDFEAWARLLSVLPEVEPAVCGDADGLAYRMDRLRCIGNGVVPQVVARAWLELSSRLGI